MELRACLKIADLLKDRLESFLRRAWVGRALEDDCRPPTQEFADRFRGGVDVAEIWGSLAQRCGDGDDREIESRQIPGIEGGTVDVNP